MSVVMIRCPVTGLPNPTGLEMDQETFRQLRDVVSRVKCIHCGREHTWWTREAWLDDGANPPGDR